MTVLGQKKTLFTKFLKYAYVYILLSTILAICGLVSYVVVERKGEMVTHV